MDKIAFLIPCYNEALTIGKVIADARKAIPSAKIYVYDNNCTDDTAKIALKAGVIVVKEPRQGKGNVVRSMFRDIDAECYIMVDGDDTYELKDAQKMADLVLDHKVDMVVGDRLSGSYYQENKRPFHNSGNNVVRYFVNHLFHTHYKDIMTGYRAFSYEFVKTYPALSKGFDTETEMSIFAADKNVSITNFPIEYRDRPKGSFSKLNTFRDGALVLRQLLGLFVRYRPLAFFAIFGLLFFGLGLGFIIPVFITYFQTHSVPNFPTLIACCFALLTAIQCFFTGFILQSLREKDYVSFEREYIKARDRKNDLLKR